MTEIDVDALRRIIQNVEHSIDAQGIEVRSRAKAELIASLYARSQHEGRVPSRRSTDQAVWMAH